MSISTAVINTLSASSKQLHGDSCKLLSEVEAIIKAKEAFGLTRYVGEHCRRRLVIALAITSSVADDLRSLLTTTVPAILPAKHVTVKGLRTLTHSVSALLAVIQRIVDSQVQDVVNEEARVVAMAKQATDLGFSINNMLMFLRGAGTLLGDMKGHVDAHDAASAGETANNPTPGTATSI